MSALSSVCGGLGLESRLYVVLFVAITFSGSLFGDFAPYLIVVELVLLVWMAAMPYGRPGGYFNTRFLSQIGLLAAFCLFLLWQTSYASAPELTLVYLRRFVVFGALLLIVPRAEVAVCAIKSAKYYALLVAGSITIGTLVLGEKTGGLVGDYQFGGMMMSVAGILFLIDYYLDGGKRVDILGFSFAMVGLFITGKRMFALIVAIIFIVLYLMVSRREKTIRLLRLVAVGLTIVVPMYLLFDPVREIVARMGLLLLDERIATSGRSILWAGAMDVFRANALIGIGFANFVAYTSGLYSYGGLGLFHVHNIYLQLLAETGVVGFVMMAGFILVSLGDSWRVLKLTRRSEDSLANYVVTYSVCIQLWFILYGLTGNGLYGWHEFFLYVSAIAMMLSAKIRLRVDAEARVAP